jgi:hypothetical protein
MWAKVVVDAYTQMRVEGVVAQTHTRMIVVLHVEDLTMRKCC